MRGEIDQEEYLRRRADLTRAVPRVRQSSYADQLTRTLGRHLHHPTEGHEHGGSTGTATVTRLVVVADDDLLLPETPGRSRTAPVFIGVVAAVTLDAVEI